MEKKYKDTSSSTMPQFTTNFHWLS